MRGRQVTRLLKLVQLLARPNGISVAEATGELECVRRTFYRDLQVLDELCYPVYTEPDGVAQRYRLQPGFRAYHRLPFTHEELTALWMARGALGALDGTPFSVGARSLLEKLEGTLSEDVRRRLERTRETIAVAAPGRRYGPRTAVLEALRRGAAERQSVELSYTSLEGRSSRRLLDPYLLWFDPATSALYAAGWAHDQAAVRTFLVDRIEQAALTTRRFELPAGWNAEQFIAESFAAFRGTAVMVRFLFTGRAARLVSERTWHPTQTVATLADGRTELTMRVPLSPGLTGWVLSWIPEVQVLEPAELAGEVVAALEAGLVGALGGKRRVARAVTPDVTDVGYATQRVRSSGSTGDSTEHGRVARSTNSRGGDFGGGPGHGPAKLRHPRGGR